MLLLITNHLNKWNEVYKNFKICDENSRVFKGKDKALNLNHKDNNLFFENTDGTRLPLYPFLLLWEEQFYIFDALIYNKEKYDVLCYPIGRKQHFKKEKVQRDIMNIFEKSNEFLKRNKYQAQSNNQLVSAEDSAFSIIYEDYLIQQDEEIYEMKELDQWLNKGLNQHENKVFLLMMERGMGKTSWVKRISEGKGFSSDIMFKTVYLNDTYHSNWEAIVSKINQTIITDKNHRVIFKDSQNKHIRLDAEDIKTEIADFINHYIDMYKKEEKADKMLLILDGIDEIKLDNNNNILDWIPSSHMLPKDFYILLTCRNSEDISDFLNTCLDELKISDENKLAICREDTSYRRVLEKYIKDNTEHHDLEKILGKAEYRFAYVNILSKLLKYTNKDNKNLILDEGEIIDTFLDMIESHYEKKHLQYLHDLIYIIATSPEPITIKEISYLLGEEKLSFKLLGFINDLKGILRYDRTDNKNKLSIANQIYKEKLIKILLEKDTDLENRFENNITELVSDIYTEFILKEKRITGEGQEFLLLHLNYYHNKDTIKYFDYKFFLGIFECAEKCIKSFSYEDTKRGYQMLENADTLYLSLSLDYVKDPWLEKLIKTHIHLICQYKLLFRWSDLYIDDNISQRLENILRECIEQQNDIFDEENMDRLKDPFIASIAAETSNMFINILIQNGSYLYYKGDYEQAEVPVLIAMDMVKLGRSFDSNQVIDIAKLLHYIYEALGEKEKAQKYFHELNKLIEEKDNDNENSLALDYKSRSIKFRNDISKISHINEKIQKIYDEIEDLENKLKLLDGSSDLYYKTCEYESLILGEMSVEIGDIYLKSENYTELLDFIEKMKEVNHRLNSRNFPMLPVNNIYLFYYGGVAHMKVGQYDQAFKDLKALEGYLNEMDNHSSIKKLPETKILYLRYILYMHLCKYHIFKNQDYKNAFENFKKAAEIHEKRKSINAITTSTEADYLHGILGLYNAIAANSPDENDDILNSLKNLFEKHNTDFHNKSRIFSWEIEYISIDKNKDEFLRCAKGENPKKFELLGQNYKIDFKRICNKCNYKDCIGYRNAGSFQIKK